MRLSTSSRPMPVCSKTRCSGVREGLWDRSRASRSISAPRVHSPPRREPQSAAELLEWFLATASQGRQRACPFPPSPATAGAGTERSLRRIAAAVQRVAYALDELSDIHPPLGVFERQAGGGGLVAEIGARVTIIDGAADVATPPACIDRVRRKTFAPTGRIASVLRRFRWSSISTT